MTSQDTEKKRKRTDHVELASRRFKQVSNGDQHALNEMMKRATITDSNASDQHCPLPESGPATLDQDTEENNEEANTVQPFPDKLRSEEDLLPLPFDVPRSSPTLPNSLGFNSGLARHLSTSPASGLPSSTSRDPGKASIASLGNDGYPTFAGTYRKLLSALRVPKYDTRGNIIIPPPQ